MNVKPKEKYVFIFPEDENGEPITKFRFLIAFGKQLREIEEKLQKALGELNGIDQIALAPQGRYTIEVVIARSFDPDEVIAELKHRLDTNVLSDIIRPKLVLPS